MVLHLQWIKSSRSKRYEGRANHRETKKERCKKTGEKENHQPAVSRMLMKLRNHSILYTHLTFHPFPSVRSISSFNCTEAYGVKLQSFKMVWHGKFNFWTLINFLTTNVGKMTSKTFFLCCKVECMDCLWPIWYFSRSNFR